MTVEVEKTEGIGNTKRRNWFKSLVELTMRLWRGVDKRRCFFANLGSEIMELKDLHRQRSCKSSFTGSMQRIFASTSKGRVGNDGDVRVSVGIVECSFLVTVASCVEYGEVTAWFGSSLSLSCAMCNGVSALMYYNTLQVRVIL